MAQSTGLSKVFVGNLSFFCSKEDLERLFCPFGEIESMHLCKSKEGEPLYYGFVHYFDSSHAQAAIAALNNTFFGGRILRVHQGHSSRATPVQIEGVEILVSFLSYQTAVTISEEVLYHIFSQYGHVEDCVVKSYTIFNDPTSPQASRQSGYGFLTLQNIESAQCVIHEVKSSTIPNFQNVFGELAYSSESWLPSPVVMLDCKLSRNASSRFHALVAHPRTKPAPGSDAVHHMNQTTNSSPMIRQPIHMNPQCRNQDYGTGFAMSHHMPSVNLSTTNNTVYSTAVVPSTLQAPVQPMIQPVFMSYTAHPHPLPHHQPSMLSSIPPPPQLSVFHHSPHIHSSPGNRTHNNSNTVYTTSSINPPPGFVAHTAPNMYTNSPVIHGMHPYMAALPSPPPAILSTFANSIMMPNNIHTMNSNNESVSTNNNNNISHSNIHLQAFQFHQQSVPSGLSRSNSHSSSNGNLSSFSQNNYHNHPNTNNTSNSTANALNLSPGISTNVTNSPVVFNNPFPSLYQTHTRFPASSSCSSSSSYVNSPAQSFLSNNNSNNGNNNSTVLLHTNNKVSSPVMMNNYTMVQQQPSMCQQYCTQATIATAQNDHNMSIHLHQNN